MIVVAIMYSRMLPARPQGHRWTDSLVMVAQWVLVPVTIILFGSVPATDAQTRLLLGGRFRLGFWVTEKK